VRETRPAISGDGRVAEGLQATGIARILTGPPRRCEDERGLTTHPLSRIPGAFDEASMKELRVPLDEFEALLNLLGQGALDA
jgi:hypothetical protein